MFNSDCYNKKIFSALRFNFVFNLMILIFNDIEKLHRNSTALLGVWIDVCNAPVRTIVQTLVEFLDELSEKITSNSSFRVKGFVKCLLTALDAKDGAR
jgi:hypothetical protein